MQRQFFKYGMSMLNVLEMTANLMAQGAKLRKPISAQNARSEEQLH